MSAQLIRRILFRHSVYSYGYKYQIRPYCNAPQDNASGNKDGLVSKQNGDLKKSSTNETKAQIDAKPLEQSDSKLEFQTEVSVDQHSMEAKKTGESKVEVQEDPVLSNRELELQIEASVGQHGLETKNTGEVRSEVQESLVSAESKLESQTEASVEQLGMKSKSMEEVNVEVQENPTSSDSKLELQTKVSVEQHNIESKNNEKVKSESPVSSDSKLELETEVCVEQRSVESKNLHLEEKVNDSKGIEVNRTETLENIKSREQLNTVPTQNVEDEKRAAAKRKLNDLLISLATADYLPNEPVTRVQLTRPKPIPKVQKKKNQIEKDKDTISSPEPTQETHIEPELVAAAKDVAESLGGDMKTTESELLSTLRSHAAETSSVDKQNVNLSELFIGMKVERKQSKPQVERQQYNRYDRDPSTQRQSLSKEELEYKRAWSSQPSRTRESIPVNLANGKKLGIFQLEKLEESKGKDDGSFIGESVCSAWDAAHQRDLELSVTHPPPNAFVEMIQWTKQGKLWTFPIDNEIGLEAEKQIGFHEHIFLERHLEGWCPKRGPVRHFMELVCNGLSKNPHLTVERKTRHIAWYRNYFESKQEILQEVGAI